MSARSFVREAARHYAALAWVGVCERWAWWRAEVEDGSSSEEDEGVEGWGSMEERRANIGSQSHGPKREDLN